MGRWWRNFVDRLTGKGSAPSGAGPRRRASERFAFETKLEAKCSSWPRFEQLVSGDVSAGGLFIPTEEVAKLGEEVEVGLTLPDGSTFTVTGKVVNIISAQQAEAIGKRAGLGIQLDPLDDEGRERYETLLSEARAQVPTPAEQNTDGEPHPVLPTPEGGPPPIPPKRRVSAVRRAVGGGGAGKASPIVGIDMGTTHTSVAAVIGRKVQILEWPDGLKSCPSVLSFPDPDTILVGLAARNRLAAEPLRTVSSPKRLLGRRYDDTDIQGFIAQAPYRTGEGPDGSVVVEMWQQKYAVVQLCSYLLREARKVAEAELEQTIERCVLTLPVSFEDDRADLLRRAAQLAQLEVVALIDEPSAAAVANRFDPDFGGIVGVYDFGGGTFDFSLVDVSRGDFVVLATAGDTWLGGDDFDSILADAAANQFWREHKIDLRNQAVEWQRVRFACERAKRMLSVEDKAQIYVPDVMRSATGMVALNFEVTRAAFDKACRPLIQRSLETCAEALELLDMKPNELSAVYLSGGTSYIPAVRQGLAQAFGVPVRTGVPPEHAVCLGAAIHAAQLQIKGAATLDARED
jgi:actin-like ATPase involved in cell morphogenesis/Tfp pilus assembly protein PilZ